jgi:glucan phosphoethanolaminetransferase (alkaline phosphatase superfamily)
MFNWLENMRRKPSATQRVWAFGISLFIVGIIFILWISFWLPTSLQTQSVAAKNNQLSTKFVTPTQNIWSDFSSVWSSVSSEYGELQQQIKTFNMTSSVQYQATTTPTSGGVGE